jgi:hypothetical protein
MRGAKAVLCAIAIAAVLSGCTSTFANLPWIGEPPGLPERPEQPPAFPAVHDMPPPRDTKLLTEGERKQLEAELANQRGRPAGGKPAPKKQQTAQ